MRIILTLSVLFSTIIVQIMGTFNFLSSPFRIRELDIPGRLLLAPMDGFTDSPFRRICREFGASLLTSEFINGIDLMYGHPHLKYKTFFHASERPFAFQVFDDEPERLLSSALKLQELAPDLIDINMGCSAKSVSNRGAGAGLLKHPEKIKIIASSLVSTLRVPITAKIRLGWDDETRNYLDIVAILVDCGISAITVHARTRKQGYSGLADWDAIAAVKLVSPVPVIGNGDVKSLEDAKKLMDHSGCEAVMVGRAALGNPWVFSGEERSKIAPDALFLTIKKHLSLMLSLYSERIGTLLFRKHLSRYLTGYLTTSEIRKKVFSMDDPSTLMATISELLSRKGEYNGTSAHLE